MDNISELKTGDERVIWRDDRAIYIGAVSEKIRSAMRFRQNTGLSTAALQLQYNIGKNRDNAEINRFIDAEVAAEAQRQDYKIYTTENDQVIHAKELIDEEELLRCRAYIDQQIQRDGVQHTQLSRALSHGMHTVFGGSDVAAKDTVVSFVVDNSGSMRGGHIMVAAVVVDLLAAKLETLGVKTEILGYTTRAWKGGASREKWLKDGKPRQPGRLNDLRHIIYKDVKTSWRKAKANLGLMMREGLLKENIDGEALQWAEQRLLDIPAERRILVYVRDGAPIDDSTLSVNRKGLLRDHLNTVIEGIEQRGEIELCGISLHPHYDSVPYTEFVGSTTTEMYQRPVGQTAYRLAMLFGPILTNLDVA